MLPEFAKSVVDVVMIFVVISLVYSDERQSIVLLIVSHFGLDKAVLTGVEVTAA